ncbi:LPXTG cell wall anchor domain-containing protein [Limosilactobacillus walteri]|uniref:LPXTG cell wall anchor domain-containing protein n=1 Tax=Limosilactobacillus walteri TaxID=2268022 RepID=A0ABR8P3G8_9LACO|nr:LPXTG cell wall anchor domain-containing protein [Limosilactobacillus walteri]MBD5805536.1 LPXTG cell wall anchor domain-containing protein [Limosilactobacillus walteri]
MEQKLHYKLFKNGKYLCTMALSTVVAITALGVTSVHADEVTAKTTDAQTTQTSQSAYQQKAAQNEQQLSDLAASNAAKETTAANSYAQANQQSANATSQQIADLQAQAAQKKQDAAQQIQAASDAMTSTITSQTQAVNNSAAAATSAAQQANAASEAQMQSANAATIAQAEQQAQQAAAHSAAAISNANAEYQTAVNNANASHQLATSAANADYTANVNNENNTYNANQQQVKNGVTAAQNVVNQAQQAVKDHTTTETVTVPGEKKNIKRITDAKEFNPYVSDTIISRWKNKYHNDNDIYLNTQLGSYSRIGATDSVKDVPSSIAEMPTDFQPGLIAYNPDIDTSEVVTNGTLTDRQKTIISLFATSWANGYRDWMYHNEPAVYQHVNNSTINPFSADTAPLQLHFTDAMQQLSKEITQERESNSLTNDEHTMSSSTHPTTRDETNLPTSTKLYDYYNTTQKQAPFGEYSTQASTYYTENLETMVPYLNKNKQLTLLGYLVGLYNMTQDMWYGELYDTHPATMKIGGHAESMLHADLNCISFGLQKLTPQEDSHGFTDGEYAFTFDPFSFYPYCIHMTHDADGKLNTRSLFAEVDPSTVPDQKIVNYYNDFKTNLDKMLGSDVTAPEFEAAVSYEKNGTGSHTEAKTVTPKEYTDALTTAQNNLKQTTADANDKLQQLSQTHQDHLKNLEAIRDNAIKQADATLKQAVDQATKTRDAKIANAQGDTTNVAKLKQELNQKYQALVKSNQAKLTAIEAKRQQDIAALTAQAKADYEAKVKQLGVDDTAVQEQIKALQAAHQAFVQANADKLAQLKADDLKAYNDLKAKLDAELAQLASVDTDKSHDTIQTGNGDHTVILPPAKHDDQQQSTDHQSSDAGVKKVNKADDTNTVNNLDMNNTVSKNTQKSVNAGSTNNLTKTSDYHDAIINSKIVMPATTVNELHNSLVNENLTANITNKGNHGSNNEHDVKLPQTGNTNSLLAITMGTVSAMFGLGLMRKKRY